MSETPNTSAFERAIAAIAPGWAMRREQARAQLKLYRDFNASYRGAVRTRVSTPWTASNAMRSGSPSDRRNLSDMQARARNVYRNNPVGRSLVNTETDNVMAEGFNLQMRGGDDTFRREAEERWFEFLERADVRGLWKAGDWYRNSWREPRIDGDGGIVLIDRGGESRLQYIPGHLIKTPWGKTRTSNSTVVDGVEVDGAGRPVAYHIQTQDERGKNDFARIEARNFVYLPHLDDPLGLRGATCYAQIFELLDQLDGYVDAVIIAARMAAIFGLIFKSGQPAKELSQLLTATNANGQQQKALTMENGMLRYVGQKDDVVQVQAQQPMQQTPDFIRAIFRLICLPFDMPLEIGQKDLSQVNFSGGRIGLLGFYRSCRVKQDWLRSQCWDRIAFWWLSRERKRQELGLPGAFVTPFPEDYGNFLFLGREWDYTDPVSEAQADAIEIDIGTKSPQQAALARGRDPEEIMRQSSEYAAKRRSLQLPANIRSSSTRDGQNPVDTLRVAADSYGVAVRAGVITPNAKDEEYFRKLTGLPAITSEVKAAWEKDGGIRKPVTLQAEGKPAAAPAEPATPTED